ncbi:MAG: YHS domain protein [Alphaproteobacteria bacterium]|nr:YHS domain protein [Alphaproteobacteria bacterium]
MYRRYASAVAAAFFTLIIAAPAQAGAVNTTLFGTAIKGYDPVAYHTLGRPVEGSKQFSYDWNEATWRFANAKHRDLFAANPERYAPAYGGYCAYAIAFGSKADIDPTAWKIVDGTLYLNLSHSIKKRWERDIPGFIARADANWPRLVS